MNTFLPYPNFHESAQCLDDYTLVRQNNDNYQIINLIEQGYYSSSILSMWKGHEHFLACYGLVICTECRKRNFRDDLFNFFEEKAYRNYAHQFQNVPPWLGDWNFHQSNRARLITIGEIERIHWRIRSIGENVNIFCQSLVNRDSRDIKVSDFAALTEELDLLEAPNAPANFYHQFGWYQFMTDEVQWPDNNYQYV